MNWDTVIEEGLQRTQRLTSIDYGCDAKRARFEPSGIKLAPATSTIPVRILKPHGSANWLYCDACRQVFWFPATMTLRIAAQLFRRTDWDVVQNFTKKRYPYWHRKYNCPACGASALGTRFATFSFRKALDFPMHESSWRSAEHLLQAARTWVFIGYSLPAADYEFKHLLKRVQLSRREEPAIVVITGGRRANETVLNYQKFFGPQIKANNVSFKDGLRNDAIKRLRSLGALTRSK